MYRYAQTNIQLYEQAIDTGYSEPDLLRVRNGYVLAAQLFSAQFRPNGKPFIAHLVGTASILIGHDTSVPLVLAGLLHAAYARGDFGGFWPRSTLGKRDLLRRVIGEEAEDLVAQYAVFRWDAVSLVDSIPQLSRIQRRVLFLRLVNELEEAVHLDMLYEHEARRQKRMTDLGHCVECARKLNMPDLAQEIEEVHSYLHSRTTPAALVSDCNSDYVSPPLSYRRRLLPAISHGLRVVWLKFPEDVRFRLRQQVIKRSVGYK